MSHRSRPTREECNDAIRRWRPAAWAVCLIAALFMVCGALSSAGSAPVAATPANAGTITGTVVDVQSRPVSGAKVYAEMSGVALGTALPWAETDATGQFAVRNLVWGTYRVAAEKLSAGYPPTYLDLYGQGRVPSVTISPAAPTTRVVVRLGPKAGVLRGQVVSAQSGGAIASATFELRRLGHPTQSATIAAPSRFNVLVPARETILVTVTAPGFGPWRTRVRTRPGELRRVTPRLPPLHRY